MKTAAKTYLYSWADWRFNGNKLGYDDLIDEQGRLVVTVSVMDLVKAEMFDPTYLEAGVPRRLFVLEADDSWSIYLNVRWLTPQLVQEALDEWGRLVGKAFVFEPHRLPAALERKYRKAAAQKDREIAEAREHGQQSSSVDELLAALKNTTGTPKERPKPPRRVSAKRLAAISAHKMKW